MPRPVPRPRLGGTKAVVFDLGGVLLDLHAAEARQELITSYGISPERFDRLTRSCFTSSRRSVTERAMIGKVNTTEYLTIFCRACSRKDIEGIRQNRLSVIGSEKADVFEIARQLREEGVTCCILSNTIALHWERLSSRRDYPSLNSFHHVFASHLIGRAKPRKNAFSHVANALGIRMSECVLVDDTLVNVNGARAAGWRAVLFTDAGNLRRSLAEKTGLAIH